MLPTAAFISEGKWQELTAESDRHCGIKYLEQA